MAGVAATERHVIVADRELDDTIDAFFCLDAQTGQEIWSVRNPAPGSLDYGNSPRATPLIDGGRVYLFGAFGHLQCVALETGQIIWSRNIRTDFKVDDKLVWGTCSSPLLVDQKLIVNPGAKDASIVALNPSNGETLHKCPGNAAAFSSFIVIEVAGCKQIVGYDAVSLGGWNANTGERLWTVTPPKPRDFNVPTPIFHDGRLIAVSENNGARIYQFDATGKLNPKPVATTDALAPDSHTPVVVGDRLVGVGKSLVCLDLKRGLRTIWESEDSAFGSYCTLIASANRVLCATQEGELILFDPMADRFAPLSRWKLFEDDRGVYSHPAIVGDRLYLRSSTSVACVLLEAR